MADCFLHVFNRPSAWMLSRCSKFEIFQRVIISDSIFVMNCESLVFKPQHRFLSHCVFFVQGKPMLVNRISFCKRMPTHPQNQNVSPRRFTDVSFPGVFFQKSLFYTPHAEFGNSLARICTLKSSNNSTSWTFNFYSLLKQYGAAWMAHIFGPSYFSRVLKFVSAQHSFISTSRTAYFPNAVSVPIGNILKCFKKLSNLFHRSLTAPFGLLGRAEFLHYA